MTEDQITAIAEAAMDAAKPRWRQIAPPKNRDALLTSVKDAIRNVIGDDAGGEDEIQP